LKAYKFVDERFAEDVQKGQFNIGSLEYFRGLPDKLRDDMEGKVEHLIGRQGIRVGKGSQFERSRLSSFGIGVAPWVDDFRMHDIVFETGVRNLPILCFCRSPENKHFQNTGREAIFEISDVEALASVLWKANPIELGPPTVGLVKYEARCQNFTSPTLLRADVFTKRPHYAVEEEIRIAWEATKVSPVSFVCKGGLANKLIIRIG
jgi:hypothetical protein